MWLTLAWKEWHEQKWKLLSLTVIALSVFLACASDAWEIVSTAALITYFGYSLLAPCFVGMTICASEHSQRTLLFVAAQPVSMWKVATVRLIAGAAVLVIPILVTGLCAGLIEAIVPQRSRRIGMDAVELGSVAYMVLLGCLASLNLYAWIVAVAVNQRTELRAGLIGLLVTTLVVGVGIMGLAAWDNVDDGVSLPGFLAVISGPLCGLAWHDMARQPSRAALFWPSAAWQGLLITSLGLMMIVRYGQSEPWLNRLTGWWRSRTWSGGVIRTPFRSPTKALLWMQWRQSIPVCVAGTVLMVLIAIFATGINPNYREVVELLCGFAVLLVAMSSLLVGTVGLTNDLEPKLYTFWRSRPIAPTKWFWLRYAAGLAAIHVFYIVPTTIFGFFFMVFGLGFLMSPFDTFVGLSFVFLFLPLVSLVVYSLGVFFACSVRHPVYSVILAVCAAICVLFLPEFLRPPNALSPISIFGMLDQASRMLHAGRIGATFGCLFGAVALAGGISAAATIAAATMVKRDVYLRT